ncbi:hypothetical protein BC936DRAFT_140277 [Jimgerdemannia flammicorona]|uniref:OTU domain-containing protein n=1 Tax=Jimgerdemannia flammicorona TaxID=994334 RepID=A0A433DH52_9FUNG|nr:hypothetical protein BC936DRAFT_140277 [Jimgerdemannia flammicorona]
MHTLVITPAIIPPKPPTPVVDVPASVHQIFKHQLPVQFHDDMVCLLQQATEYTLQYSQIPHLSNELPSEWNPQLFDINVNILRWLQVQQHHIQQIKNVKSDGNCGFRSLAVAIYTDEMKWGEIRKKMLAEVTRNSTLYSEWLGYDIQALQKQLQYIKSPCPLDGWFLTPDCAQVAADLFKATIVMYNAGEHWSYLPLQNIITYPTPIVLHFVDGDHIILLKLDVDSSLKLPRINHQHRPVCVHHNLQSGLQNLDNFLLKFRSK